MFNWKYHCNWGAAGSALSVTTAHPVLSLWVFPSAGAASATLPDLTPWSFVNRSASPCLRTPVNPRAGVRADVQTQTPAWLPRSRTCSCCSPRAAAPAAQTPSRAHPGTSTFPEPVLLLPRALLAVAFPPYKSSEMGCPTGGHLPAPPR